MSRTPVLAFTAAIWAAALVQGSWLAPYHPLAPPNGPLVVALCGAWLTGATAGAWLGFWAGALMASLTGMFFGSFTISYLIAGWCAGAVREAVYNDWAPLVIPIAGLGTLAGEILFFLWNPRHAGAPLPMVEQAALNALLSPFIYFPMRWVQRKWSAI